MSRNGSGTYNLPAGNPVVTGNTISSSWANTTLSDIASALTGSIAADGQTTPTANLVMGTFAHTGVGNATARTMYASAGQVQDSVLTYLTSVAGTNAITASAPIVMTAYATGQTFQFIASASNTGATTININSIGLKSITRDGTTALVAGDIVSGGAYQVIYDGTQFQLTNSSNASVQVTSFSAGTTGLTPSTATTGAITLGGTLGVANGGTGLTTLASSRIPYGNGTGALSSSSTFVFNGTNLGIGIASPTTSVGSTLHINDTTSQGAELHLTDSATSGSAAGDGGILLFAGNELYLWNQENSFMSFGTNNAESMRINSVGNVALKGGATTANGVGITFPATQSASTNANTLDDYEEGTFTPAITFGGGSTGITYNRQYGAYTKIGNRVAINIYVAFTNKGSSTGDVILSGLPFTNATGSLSSADTAATVNLPQVITTGQFVATVGDNSTNIYITQINSAGTVSQLNNTNFANNSAVQVSVCYQTA